MLYQELLKEKQKIERQIDSLNQQMTTFPQGNLSSTKNTRGTKWYFNDGEKTIYLPKKQRAFAEQLAHKKYVALQLKNLNREKDAIELYLNHHDSNAYQTEQSFINSIQYKDLLSPIFTPISEELQNWQKEPYEKSDRNPENLIHQSHSGNFVRSKAEATIDMFLYKNQIPFRYECCLHLGNVSLFPDFTIRHPKTGDLYYWEHFGMMDNPSYAQQVLSKLHLYISHGIIPSIQLITTYETKTNPLSLKAVETLVEHYFL